MAFNEHTNYSLDGTALSITVVRARTITEKASGVGVDAVNIAFVDGSLSCGYGAVRKLAVRIGRFGIAVRVKMRTTRGWYP